MLFLTPVLQCFRNIDMHIVMAALCNRAGHYIFTLWFLSFFLSSFFFFPGLISAATDWMSTIRGVALVQI